MLPQGQIFFAEPRRAGVIDADQRHGKRSLLDIIREEAPGHPRLDAIEIGLGLPSTIPINSALDSDGDGQTDLFEIHAGTDYRNAGDRFVWSVKPPAAGQPPTVTMAVKIGRTYRIHSSAQLAAGDWQVVEVVLPGQDGVHVFTDSQSPGKRFYRIEAKLNP